MAKARTAAAPSGDQPLPPAAEWAPLDSLVPWEHNPRRNDTAVPEVAASIARFGFGAPIVARRETREIIKGHTRRKAVLSLNGVFPGQPGPGLVPVRFLDITEDEAHTLALADNRLGEIAGWDEEAFALEVAKLLDHEVDLTTGTGIPQEEIDAMVASTDPTGAGAGPADFGAEGEVDDGFVAFRFGDYAGRVTRTVYAEFVDRYKATQQAGAAPMLDDVLRAWLRQETAAKAVTP